MAERILLGRLTIKIIKGDHLHDTKLMQRMDPYVKVTSLDPDSLNLKWKTKIDKNGGKNPKWHDEERTIDVYDLHDKLHFQLFDEDDLTKDDFIGEMRHSIKQLMNHEGEHAFELTR